jgi:hypothetical protein
MGKPEIKPFVADLICRLQVLNLLFFSHGVPLVVTHSVAPNVVHLSQCKSADIEYQDAQQDPISSLVPRGIIWQKSV